MPENKTKLLLHICCGPCSTSVIETLKENYDITGYFYNPNIHPEEEYTRRVEALEHFFSFLDIPLVIDIYDPEKWYADTAGLESEPEGGKRCSICFLSRIERALEYAGKHDFPYITTTLTVSPLKNADLINEIGRKAASEYNKRAAGHNADAEKIIFLEANFKKKNGYQRSIALSKEYNLYRQNYCGCIFSKRD